MIKDPNILLSYINTKLRENYASLDGLVEDLDFDKEEIISILNKIDYVYNQKENRFIKREDDF